ncbi:MAG: DegV family EDD domain-containing protein [Candidatus Marinimicrobia bacterium]|nr:DegV family EDD domain-containing protein [Candidatus Neomarinimicrobiota bacterium]MBT4149473.1 DegV family EDD domain-containing protein [Candidatus Neomarinimicrobiota bacterium]
MAIEYIDGIRLYRSITAGLRRVVSRQEYLNKINVFPVPDGDTGTNMAYTLTSIEDGIQNNAYSDIKKMSMKIADSALDGARGNSGAILAQFFVGFADGIKDVKKLNSAEFSQAIAHAKNYSYDALTKPREGTILSVIGGWSESLETSSKISNDFLSILSTGLIAAQKALDNTPNQLEVLAKAGVLDAGAQGFVDMLSGIQEFIESGSITEAELKIIEELEEVATTTNEKFRYCTECIILGENIPRRLLQERLMDLGNSIVLAGTKIKAKVHIHSDDPHSVFSLCKEYGSIKGEKTDDMIKQQADAHSSHSSTAIIVDSGCDLPDELIDNMNIHVIPVRLNFGDTHYVDKVSLTSDEFWKELEKNPMHPQTSQPSPGDFRRQYQFLSSHYESAVSIHLPEALSGTYQSALTAARSLSSFPVNILDSFSGSIGTGLIAMRTAEAIIEGKNIDEINIIAKQAIENTQLYVGLNTLDNIVKGGRISPTVKKIANFFKINPYLAFKKEGLKPVGLSFGNKNKSEKFRKFVENKIPQNKKVRVGISHAQMNTFVDDWRKDLIRKFGDDNVIITDVGPALGVHAGPKVLCFAIQILNDDLNK